MNVMTGAWIGPRGAALAVIEFSREPFGASLDFSTPLGAEGIFPPASFQHEPDEGDPNFVEILPPSVRADPRAVLTSAYVQYA